MDKNLIEKVSKLVTPIYEKIPHELWYYGLPHIDNVVKTSEELANLEGVGSLPCIVSAQCHDLGRILEAQKGERDLSFEGNRDHARLSIWPTVQILNKIGIDQELANYIVEAVAVHSYWHYEGKSPITKILRGADKRDALGPWGLLRTSADHLGRLLVPRQEVLDNVNNPEKIKALADRTLGLISKDPELSTQFSNTGLKKVLEWVDNKEFHTDSAYELFAEDIKYTQDARTFLST